MQVNDDRIHEKYVILVLDNKVMLKFMEDCVEIAASMSSEVYFHDVQIQIQGSKLLKLVKISFYISYCFQ
jgi:hypothetical protein